MIDWIKAKNEELYLRVKDYIEKSGKSDIAIPIRDFLVLFDATEQVCSEWAGAAEINEIYAPVYEEYYKQGFSSI